MESGKEVQAKELSKRRRRREECKREGRNPREGMKNEKRNGKGK